MQAQLLLHKDPGLGLFHLPAPAQQVCLHVVSWMTPIPGTAQAVTRASQYGDITCSSAAILTCLLLWPSATAVASERTACAAHQPHFELRLSHLVITVSAQLLPCAGGGASSLSSIHSLRYRLVPIPKDADFLQGRTSAGCLLQVEVHPYWRSTDLLEYSRSVGIPPKCLLPPGQPGTRA